MHHDKYSHVLLSQRPHSVAQDDPKLMVLLPQLPRYWDFRCVQALLWIFLLCLFWGARCLIVGLVWSFDLND